jgi:endoglucanase
MTNIFQRMAQAFHNLERESILATFNLSQLQGKNVKVSATLLKALGEIVSWRQLRHKTKNRAMSVPRFRRAIRYGTSAVLAFLLVVLSQFPKKLESVAIAADTVQTPLSTNGSQIVDKTGTAVLLRGVNWFGIETQIHAPYGLLYRDYKQMLAQIKNLGYNTIRLPFSVQSLRSSNISEVNFSIGSNSDLQGKTPLQVMDLVIQEAQRQGLMILLDSHRLNDQSIPELWYGDGFTETDWIDTWKMLATRYKNQTNVIGADLKNEPHGQASWGTGNQATDWRLAAERAGNAIQGINPDWLIVVEGVENNVPGQQLYHWWGGNLEGVKNYPVRLNVPKKLVYSPHEYGAGVYNQPWFSDPTFPNNMPSRWETGFNYIATQGIAPILIGEFGGRQVDSTSKEGIWQQKLVDFIKQKNLSFTYWSWNPNSSDTGGILQDDWTTVNAAKQQLLNTLLPAPGLSNSSPSPSPSPSPAPSPSPSPAPSPAPSPSPSPAPSPAPSPSPSPAPSPAPSPSPGTPQLKAEALVQSDWQTGFCINLVVTNQGTASSKNWQLTFTPNQATITNAWGGNFLPQGTNYQVIPEQWGQVIQPNQSYTAGYCANKQGSNYKPTNVSVSGS